MISAIRRRLKQLKKEGESIPPQSMKGYCVSCDRVILDLERGQYVCPVTGATVHLSERCINSTWVGSCSSFRVTSSP